VPGTSAVPRFQISQLAALSVMRVIFHLKSAFGLDADKTIDKSYPPGSKVLSS
jgi:hypothetical protein